MVARFAAAVLLLLSGPAVALAQQPSTSVPLYPGAAPRSIELQPLPPPAPPAPAVGAPAVGAPAERVFCDQQISMQLADPEAVAEPYRAFVGIWSDASWTPQLCAALIIENVAPDGTATILYVFGPMGANARVAGGVLQGTGVIRDGELRFQNSDGSQFAFRPVYADFEGRLTTPQGQSYQAIFKKTP